MSGCHQLKQATASCNVTWLVSESTQNQGHLTLLAAAGQGQQFGIGLLAAATVLLQGFLGLDQLLGYCTKAARGFFRVRT